MVAGRVLALEVGTPGPVGPADGSVPRPGLGGRTPRQAPEGPPPRGMRRRDEVLSEVVGQPVAPRFLPPSEFLSSKVGLTSLFVAGLLAEVVASLLTSVGIGPAPALCQAAAPRGSGPLQSVPPCPYPVVWHYGSSRGPFCLTKILRPNSQEPMWIWNLSRKGLTQEIFFIRGKGALETTHIT